jgi:hypothetical protein
MGPTGAGCYCGHRRAVEELTGDDGQRGCGRLVVGYAQESRGARWDYVVPDRDVM